MSNDTHKELDLLHDLSYDSGMIISPSQIRMALGLLGLNLIEGSKTVGVSRNTLALIVSADLKDRKEGATEPNTRSVRKIRDNLSELLESQGWTFTDKSLAPIPSEQLKT